MFVKSPLQFTLSILVITFIFSMSILVYFHNRKSRVNRLFTLFLLIFDAWSVTGMAYYNFPVVLHRWVAAQMLFGVCMAPAFYVFARSLTDEDFRLKWPELAVFLPALYVVCVSLLRIVQPGMSLDFAGKVRMIDQKLERVVDVNYYVYSLTIIGDFIAGLLHIALNLRKEKDPLNRRRSLTILITVFVGSFFMFGVTIVSNLLGKRLDMSFSLAGILVMVAVTSVSLIRHKAWSIEHLLELIQRKEEELIVRNQTIESELDLARLVQKRLMPARPPSIKGLNVDFYYRPMDKVGGDFYDYRIDKDNLGIIIADVSGHGIPGAFLATVAKMGFEYFSGMAQNGSVLMMNLDRLISERAVKSMFVTALYTNIDACTMTMTYTNCGHCYPILYGENRGGVMELASVGRPLGVSFGVYPAEQEIKLEHKDRILLYTDGIVETLNDEDEEYSEERLKDFLYRNYRLPSREFSDNLFDSLRDFSGRDDTMDDISLTIVDVL